MYKRYLKLLSLRLLRHICRLPRIGFVQKQNIRCTVYRVHFNDGFCCIAARVECGNKRLCEQGAENIIMRTNKLFTKNIGRQNTADGEMRSYYGTNTMFKRFLEKHGLGDAGIHFYRLRHTFSNTLFEAQENPKVIQLLMGHKKVETTMI